MPGHIPAAWRPVDEDRTPAAFVEAVRNSTIMERNEPGCQSQQARRPNAPKTNGTGRSPSCRAAPWRSTAALWLRGLRSRIGVRRAGLGREVVRIRTFFDVALQRGSKVEFGWEPLATVFILG